MFNSEPLGSAVHNPGYCMAPALEDLAEHPQAWNIGNPKTRTGIINEAFRPGPAEVLVHRYTAEPYEIRG